MLDVLDRGGGWSPWIWFGGLVWGLMSALTLVRAAASAFAARRLVRRATDTAPGFVRLAAANAATEAGLRWGPSVRVSERVASPVVWCWGRRPVIVVPAHCDPDVDWGGVMRHELAHWMRRDHLADALARAVIALVPIHPLAWVTRAWLERLAERACDDWAISRGGSTAYAQSLVTLAARIRGPRVALPVARKGSDLGARVRRVLNVGAVRPRVGRNWLIAGVAAASCATALVALARHPLGEVKVVEPPQVKQPEPGPAGVPKADNPARPEPPAIADGVDIAEAVKMVYDTLAAGEGAPVFTLADAIANRNDQRAIPLLIGVIDSDNTYWSVYGIGHFALSRLTGVRYDDRYDGTWWKAWWEKNKGNYSPEARATAIPTYPPTKSRIARVYDFGEWAGLTKGEPPERLLKEIERRLQDRDHSSPVKSLAERLVAESGPRAIPWLIGVIDSDNTYATIYDVGYFGLSKITGVPYDDRRDGTWWRAWWEKNKAKYPLDAQQTPIPRLSRSANFVERAYDWGQYVGEVDTEPTSRLMDELKRRLEADSRASSIAQAIAARRDLSVVPELIAIIVADKGGHAKYDVGYFGLTPLTGVQYEGDHDGAWWAKWWEENKARYAGRASAELPKVKLEAPPARAEPGDDEAAADVKDVPNRDIHIDGDANKRYFLIGAEQKGAPGEALALLVIVPGGDGSADFNPFIRRIWQNALPKGFVVAQAVAPKWRDSDDRIVWPTEKLPDEKMKFATEQFMEEIVKDVRSKVNIDPEKVFALGWSSGGPPVYAATMREGSSFRGAFVAMSVYHPETLPEPKGLKGKSFYVFHSPQDFIKMNFPRKAIEQLSAGGARTTLVEYEGGHGWRGPIWKNIRTGVEWLMAKDNPAPPAPAAKPKP